MSDEERGFEVIDKRGVPIENSGGTVPEPPVDDDDELMDLEEGFDGGPPPMAVTVQGVLRFAIEMLSNRAWVAMGLIPDPMSGKIDRNMDEARRAIDVLGDLARHAETDAEPQEKRDLRNMLADLRVNFIRQSNQAG